MDTIKLITLATLFSTSLIGAAISQESCLPALQPDIIQLSTRTQERLVVLDKLINQTDQSNSSNVGAMYEGYKFDFTNSKRVASSLNKLLSVDYSREETENIIFQPLVKTP